MRHGFLGMTALALLVPTMLGAHGASYERLPEAEAVVLQFRYSIGEPMADSDVIVQAPGGQRWQQGRTDGAGRFALVPEREGRWTVIVDDGLGHELRAEVEVGADAAAPAPTVRAVGLPPRLLYALLLASLVANALLVWRRRPAPP